MRFTWLLVLVFLLPAITFAETLTGRVVAIELTDVEL